MGGGREEEEVGMRVTGPQTARQPTKRRGQPHEVRQICRHSCDAGDMQQRMIRSDGASSVPCHAMPCHAMPGSDTAMVCHHHEPSCLVAGGAPFYHSIVHATSDIRASHESSASRQLHCSWQQAAACMPVCVHVPPVINSPTHHGCWCRACLLIG